MFSPKALLRPQAYAHRVDAVRCVETHISWVFLTGEYAYKVKKPVNLGFLDFSTLDLRRAACEAELRLNRRLAPELYLDVVPVAGTPGRPRVGGDGEAFEYAVRMREFPQDAQLDRQLDDGRLGASDMDSLGRRIAEFHERAPVAGPQAGFGNPEQVCRPVRENFEALLSHLRKKGDGSLLRDVSAVRDWSEARAAGLEPALSQRKDAGRIREVHGDLHLANLARIGDRIVPFDCIEFSESLRWIDVISDLAFLLMDLQFRGRSDFACRLLNVYLECTGDYDAVRVLRYYLVYRALVRAKVALIRAGQEPARRRGAEWKDVTAHAELAMAWVNAGEPTLTLMHGLSGSGKTRASEREMAQRPAVRIRSDVERKRLLGLGALADTRSGLATGAYAADATRRTYDRLLNATRAVLEGGEDAIVDASFLRYADRMRFRALAGELGAGFRILSCTAPDAELKRRIAARRRGGHDASEADLDVLEYQKAHVEPLRDDERAASEIVDSSQRARPASGDLVPQPDHRGEQ